MLLLWYFICVYHSKRKLKRKQLQLSNGSYERHISPNTLSIGNGIISLWLSFVLKGAVKFPTTGSKVFLWHTRVSVTWLCNGMQRPSSNTPLTLPSPRDPKGGKGYFQYTPLTLQRVLFKISIFIWLGIYTIQETDCHAPAYNWTLKSQWGWI